MKKILSLLKKLLGKNLTANIRPLGHGIKSYLSALYFGFPAKKLYLIGITGTKGKTSTTIFTGRLLNLQGIKAGYLSTALIKAGPQEILNPYKMTTIDGFWLNKHLAEMVKNGFTHCVLEMSSLGLEQNRHWGLGKFQITMFLNIYPEHIEAHGSWDKYRKSKSILFQNLHRQGSFIATNDFDQKENTNFMWAAIPNNIKPTTQKILLEKGVDYTIYDIPNEVTKELEFYRQSIPIKTPTKFTADFEVINCMFALKALEVVQKTSLTSENIQLINYLGELPGRMEWVVKDGMVIYGELPNGLGQNPTLASETIVRHTLSNLPANNIPISILVDYAHEPESLKQLLQTLQSWKTKASYTQVIHVLSCDGAGRDDWKKPIMGDLSFQYADYTLITTDNYDSSDSPEEIIHLLSQNFSQTLLNKKYFLDSKRILAFQKALQLAKGLSKADVNSKILIVSTGVGSEQGLTQPEGRMDWDEREEWRKVLNSII